MSIEGDADFFAYDEIEQCSQEFFLENHQSETDDTKDSKSCQTTYDGQFAVLREKHRYHRLIGQYPNTSRKNLRITLTNSTFCTQTLPMKKWYSWLIY